MNQRLLVLIGSILALGAVIGYSYIEYTNITKESTKINRYPETGVVVQQTDIPSEFGRPVFRKPPEPEIREVIKVIEREPKLLPPKVKPKLNPQDIFNFQKKHYELSSREKQRRTIINNPASRGRGISAK